MRADPSTLLVIAFLAFAASLASYSVAISPYFRRNRPVAWAGFGIGTALLIAATVIMVLTTSHWTALLAHGGNDQFEVTRSGASFPRTDTGSGGTPSERTAGANTSATTRTALGAPARSSSAPPIAARSDRSATSDTAATPAAARFSSDYRARLTSVRSFGPWGSTRCVFAVRPDPAEPFRWSLENECGVAVAIVFASCAGPQCVSRDSTSWKYADRPMLLPSKAQRSVTYAEQTQHGEYIRYAACAIVTPSVAEFAGKDPASRDTWNPFNALRDDECVVGVQDWLATGRRSGLSIDALISGVPGRVLP